MVILKYLLWILVALVVFALLHVVCSLIAAYCIYDATLKRKSKEQWGRDSEGENDLQNKMFAIGREWHKENIEYKKDVHIVNDGLNLYGEFYYKGSKKAVLVLSGRTDTLKYGYYFAKPYWESGYNVLVIDSRAHGESDGVYNSLGVHEGRDALEWIKFICKEYGVESFVLHGLCIGAAAGVYAVTSPDSEKYVSGMVSEGMFVNFGESMKKHLIERKRLWFPVLECIDFWVKRYTGHSMMKGPIDCVGKIKKPILMLQSKEDRYSTAENAQKLFDACSSEKKKLVLFEKGAHSMVRINNEKKYDEEIKAFLAKIEQKAFA